MEKGTCTNCFNPESKCTCVFVQCALCNEDFPTNKIYEHRGVYGCVDCIPEIRMRREAQRQQVIENYNHSVRSQTEGEWMNGGGYKYMKTDGGRPVTETKTPQDFKDYEDGKL